MNINTSIFEETNVTTSNLAGSDDLTTVVRDLTAEAKATSKYAEVSTYISDEEANNNLDIVFRNGSRVHAGGDYRPDDVLVIDGMEVTYEMAQSLGLIAGSDFTSPQDDCGADAENAPEMETSDDLPQETLLLHDQLELAVGDQAPAVLETFGNDIVTNGEISEEGFRYAQEKLGISEASLSNLYEDLREVGGQVLGDFLETGDGLGNERIAFLVDLAETGDREQQAIVRNIWFQAATGKLTRAAAAEAFDNLYQPYE